MRALTYHATRDVRVESVPDPVIQDNDDIILKVTSETESISTQFGGNKLCDIMMKYNIIHYL